MEQTAGLLHRFAFLDIETTGLDFERCEVIEMALVYVEHGVRIGEKSWLVRPSGSIPPFITTLTSLTDADVEHAPSFAEVREDFRAAIAGWTLVAHNASFERGFLGDLIEDSPVLDSCELSHLLFPELPSHSLDSLIRWTGVGRGARHRALADAEDTFAVVEKLLAIARTQLSHLDVDDLVRCLQSVDAEHQNLVHTLLVGLRQAAESSVSDSVVHRGCSLDLTTLSNVRLFFCQSQHQHLLASSHRDHSLAMAHAYAVAALKRCGSLDLVPVNSWFSVRYELVRAVAHVLTQCTCDGRNCFDFFKTSNRQIDLRLDAISFVALAELADQVEPDRSLGGIIRSTAMQIEHALGDEALHVDVSFESPSGRHPAVDRMLKKLRACHAEFDNALQRSPCSDFFEGSVKVCLWTISELCRPAPPGMMTFLRQTKLGLCLSREPEEPRTFAPTMETTAQEDR